MDEKNLAQDRLLAQIQRYLIIEHGKLLATASLQEFYQAFCKALKEQIMLHWIASAESMKKNRPRTLFYFSMEYLPGRFIDNNILHTGTKELVEKVLKKTPFTLQNLVAMEPDPGLGNGGLGRLASCFLDSLAALQIPAFGYGLRYQYGIFEQEIWNGIQIERPDCWLLRKNPWEFRQDSLARFVHYSGNILQKEPQKLENFEEVRAIAYDYPIIGFPNQKEQFSVVTLRLWSTKESPRNFALQRYNAGKFGEAGENTSLTDVLYPNDSHTAGKRIRLKQEFLLVSASLQDLLNRHFSSGETIDTLEDKVRIQVNDTHPGLVIPELIRLLIEKDPQLSLQKALAITRNVTSYTNHTILKEALEDWNEERMLQLLPRQYNIIQELNVSFCKEVNKHFLQQEQASKMSIIQQNQILMASLLIYGTNHVNGVAKLHTSILQNSLFADFNKMYPEKFCNVTNGVSHRKWLLEANPALAEFITKKIGNEWIYDFSKIKELQNFAKDKEAQKEFLAIKEIGKQQLIEFLNKTHCIRNEKGACCEKAPVLTTDALFTMQIKRIHEYKRQLLYLLHTLIVYLELVKNPAARPVKRMVFLAGKAAPGYENAKHILHFAHLIARKINNDPKTCEKLCLVFIENYNVSKTLMMIPAADLSEQISLAGKEASGTGNMKLAMNGALTIGTDDGANVEMREEVGEQYWPFCFGMSVAEVKQARENYSPKKIYEENSQIKEALDFIVSEQMSNDPAEKLCLTHIRKILLEGDYDDQADEYFVLQDFASYYEKQKKVEALFSERNLWAEYALHNIASMGKFTSDRSIKEYIQNIWEVSPCPIHKEALSALLQELPWITEE